MTKNCALRHPLAVDEAVGATPAWQRMLRLRATRGPVLGLLSSDAASARGCPRSLPPGPPAAPVAHGSSQGLHVNPCGHRCRFRCRRHCHCRCRTPYRDCCRHCRCSCQSCCQRRPAGPELRGRLSQNSCLSLVDTEWWRDTQSIAFTATTTVTYLSQQRRRPLIAGAHKWGRLSRIERHTATREGGGRNRAISHLAVPGACGSGV